MHHTRRIFNSLKLYRLVLAPPLSVARSLLSLSNDNFVVVRRYNELVSSPIYAYKTALKRIVYTLTHTQMWWIHANNSVGVDYFIEMEKACDSLSSFSSRKQQTICEHTRFEYTFTIQEETIYTRVSFIILFSIVVDAMILLSSRTQKSTYAVWLLHALNIVAQSHCKFIVFL